MKRGKSVVLTSQTQRIFMEISSNISELLPLLPVSTNIKSELLLHNKFKTLTGLVVWAKEFPVPLFYR